MENASGNGKELNIVIASVKPYVYELNKIIVLPSKAEYRNRFKPKYIEARLKGKKNTRLLKGYEGKHANLILKTHNLYIPIRKIKITSIAPYSTMVYVHYELHEFFDYDSDINDCLSNLNHYSERIESELEELKDKGENKPLVFESKISADRVSTDVDENKGLKDQEKEYNQWGHLAKVLESQHHFEYTPFLKLLSVQDISNDEERKKYISDGAIVLKPNRIYRIAILHEILNSPSKDKHIVSELGTAEKAQSKSSTVLSNSTTRDYFEYAPYTVSINNITHAIKVLSGPKVATGKSDILEFLIKTNATSESIRDVINIKHVTPGTMEKHTNGVVELHIEVERFLENVKRAKAYMATSLSFYAITLWVGLIGKIPEPYTNIAADFAIASVSISVALFLTRRSKSEK